MNTCLKHQQQYDPKTGWCVYCGPPGGMHAAPVPVQPWPPSWPAWGGRCIRCGNFVVGQHTCYSVGATTTIVGQQGMLWNGTFTINERDSP